MEVTLARSHTTVSVSTSGETGCLSCCGKTCLFQNFEFCPRKPGGNSKCFWNSLQAGKDGYGARRNGKSTRSLNPILIPAPYEVKIPSDIYSGRGCATMGDGKPCKGLIDLGRSREGLGPSQGSEAATAESHQSLPAARAEDPSAAWQRPVGFPGNTSS